MTDPADYQLRTSPTWTRDLGALRAVADWEAQKGASHFGDPPTVAAATGVDEELLRASLLRWERNLPPVLDGVEDGYAEDVSFTGLTAAGRRLVGLWPSPENTIDQLVRALELAADGEQDEAKRSRLKTAALVVGNVARDIAVGAVAQTLGGAM